MIHYEIAPGQTVTFSVTATGAVPPDPPPDGPPWEDVIEGFPVNPHAQNPASSPGRWATGVPTGITVHHTGTDDPVALANYCLGKRYLVRGLWRVGLPTSQYHIFIHADGQALLCVPLDQRFWHDHGGYPNPNISIGLAGYWHKTPPPDVMIESLAAVVAHLMREYDIPLIRVRGHRTVALRAGVTTECPGWYASPVGSGWYPLFLDALQTFV